MPRMPIAVSRLRRGTARSYFDRDGHSLADNVFDILIGGLTQIGSKCEEPGCFWHSNGAYYYSPGNHGRRDGWRPVGCRGRLGGLGPSGIPRSNKRARLCNQRRGTP